MPDVASTPPMQTAAVPFLRVRGLVKRYPGVVALDGADLDVQAGEILGLLGKNGAGKSTLIKILAGAVRPDAGEIRLDGEPIEIADARAAAAIGLAFVHQELRDVPNLTVAENVYLGLGYPRRGHIFVSRGEMRRRTCEVLVRLEADIDPRAPVASLSVAHRRLVLIAHALAADSRAIVLDEPTASLTEDEIEHLHRVLRRMRDDGVAVIYVSHRLDEVFSVTDRVAVMRDGHTTATALTASLTKRQLIAHITGSTEQERVAKHTAEIGQEVLRVEGLTVPGFVHGASFALRRGDVLGIAGLVGAGRTELMRVIAGADRAAAGAIAVAGRQVQVRSPRDALTAGIVLLPEDRAEQGAILDFSLRANVTLPTLPRHRLRAQLPVPSLRSERRTTAELTRRLGIKVADAEQPVRQLSGGNQQKAILAKWLESGAEVFIFDEPTHGIDVEGKREVYEAMGRLASEGKGIIFISSEFAELVGVCNRVIVMREGRLLAELRAEQVTEAQMVHLCYGDEHDRGPAADPATMRSE